MKLLSVEEAAKDSRPPRPPGEAPVSRRPTPEEIARMRRLTASGMPKDEPEVQECRTVADLIEALSKVEDKALPVSLEGCDCWGTLSGVAITSTDVELRR